MLRIDGMTSRFNRAKRRNVSADAFRSFNRSFFVFETTPCPMYHLAFAVEMRLIKNKRKRVFGGHLDGVVL